MNALPDPDDVQALMAQAQLLPGLSTRKGALERLVADYRRGFSSEERALVVAFIGATGAGKSTLINALAGSDVAEEGVDRPTSRFPVIYAPEDALLEALAGVNAKVARYQVRPGAPWSGQVFVDTPDLNSVVREHRELARAIADRADVVVVVMHRGSVAESSQAEFLDEFAQRRRVVFVLNFADQLGAEARTQLKQQIRALAASRHGIGEEDAPVFAISATEARRGNDPTGELSELVRTLEELGSRSAIERVRRSNALAVLRQLQAQVAPARAQADQAVGEVGAALEKGLAEARSALEEDFQRRLAAAHGHLANEVRRQASGRWWGPAAWWMRLSMLGAGGLGTAALVARRN
ncbi:MAG: 50S ribosome-binding GTPase, partial [Myxococcota bacterium]|nr:50S ribosome-binding GTPase [Myxococcota bacterium]